MSGVAFGVASALGLAACTMSLASPPPAEARTRRDVSTGASAESAALEREVFALVNRHRRARGLPALALDARISRQARQHSLAMAAGSTPPGHRGFDRRVQALRRVMPCRGTAENVAFNRRHRSPASTAVRDWLASRGHRRNIEGRYESTGVGVAANGAGEVYFTQIFVGR